MRFTSESVALMLATLTKIHLPSLSQSQSHVTPPLQCYDPMNVKRTVESFARVGAAGVMTEDQTWPKRRHLL